MTPRNIILTGFMGTGKTTVGQLVADFIGWHFVDTDDEVESRFGKSIPDIFKEDGEAAFRRYERIICQSLAARDTQVIATGGGALVDPATRELMLLSGLVVCLTASPEVIHQRLADGEGRPLAANWEQLLEQRREAYAAIPYQIDTSDLEPQDVAEKVIGLWRGS
ncbi:MAG: shikimate kinase [bacterium]|nr:shikimate kinase [bacterium]